MKHVMEHPKFMIYPDSKTNFPYPGIVWITGWLGIFKAIIWLTTDPNISQQILKILGYKYLLFMIPLLFFGIGIWNFRKWAAWGLIIVAVLEILFFILYPQGLSSLSLDRSHLLALVLSFVVMIVNGPLSDIFILCVSFILLKHSGKYELLEESPWGK